MLHEVPAVRLQLPRGLNLMIEQNAKGACEEWLNLARDEKRRRLNTAPRTIRRWPVRATPYEECFVTCLPCGARF